MVISPLSNRFESNMIDLKFFYRGWKARFRDQKYEVASIRSALRKDDIAVDVGCNKGSYLWAMSSAVPNGKVVAFEPQPVLVDYLKNACARSRLDNVTIEGAGVSSACGTLRLAIPGEGDSSPGASFETAVSNREKCRFLDVPTYSLDKYFQHKPGHIGAIKIDVEGHEMAVLDGARETIKRNRPLVVCESEQRHLTGGDVLDLFTFFRSLDYNGYFSTRDSILPVEEFRPSIHQKQIGERFWDAKDYYNNFVFFPR